MNNDNKLEGYKTEIYGDIIPERQLPESDITTHFLDINFTINNGKFILSTYDKRDGFGYEPIQFTQPGGNTDSRKDSDVIIGKLITFAKVNTLYSDFKLRANKLFNRLRKKNQMKKKNLTSRVWRFVRKNEHLLSRFNRPIKDVVEDITREG